MKSINARQNNKAPFNCSSIRFDSIGYHPGLDITGILSSRQNKLGPGQYNPHKFECPCKKASGVSSDWTRKKDIEEFSKYLGFRNPGLLVEKAFEETCGGPGVYNIPDHCFKSCGKSKENSGFTMQKRDLHPIKHNNPPPGTYKTDLLASKQFCHVPTFEWDGFADRFKSTEKSWAFSPNRYFPKDHKSVQGLMEKVVSKRGPYDLFTGPRDHSTIKNHFSLPSFKGPINFFNTYPSELEVLLSHPTKRRCGRFLKEERFDKPTLRHMVNDVSLCYRNPADPGPFSYTIEPAKEFRQNKYAFNKSVQYAFPQVKWQINPGPGRYTPQLAKCTKTKSLSWMFKSKSKRSAMPILI